ncbi:protein-disulfide reductase DsbD [Pasteurellaceae bacterium RH1A]|nr:protein-disulfide reductase DsbD [Pasteurellaceae bacterium RH1A]
MFTRFLIFFLSLWSLTAQAGLFDKKPAFLPPEQAFAFSAQVGSQAAQLNWQIAEGYYLYQKEIKVNGLNVEASQPVFPEAEQHEDEFFGLVNIFRNQLSVTVPFQAAQEAAQLEVFYQGCTKGFCYPPERVTVDLNPQQAGQNPPNLANPAPQAQQEVLAQTLSQNRFSIFWFFVLGLGLAFTPCVLPMLPLLSAIVIGKSKRPSTAKALLLSFTYVQGMALTYTLLGLIVAAIGLPFQIALQSPPVLIGLAVLFTVLALSMFGLFEIKLPNSWQQKLNALSQKQEGGALGSVFVMGMIAGLVASPCTSAPLSGALLYVAQSGDLITGGLALYLLALGMGLPLILITLFGNRILPKSGDWLLLVKTAFGFVMLALPVFLLSRVFGQWEAYLWSALAIAFLVWLSEQIKPTGWLKRGLRIALLALLVVAAKPFADLVWPGSPSSQVTQSQHFERIASLADLEQKLTAYKGKKVMLELYADWCVACKEFEKYTFTDPQVKARLDQMAVLQIDMTKNSAQNDELMKHFQVLGLPTILFFDEEGRELTQQRVTGFMQAGEFLDWLNQL